MDILLESGNKVVKDNTGLFGGVYDPNNPSVLYIDPDSETRVFVTPEMRVVEREEEQIEEAESPPQEPRAGEAERETGEVEGKPPEDAEQAKCEGRREASLMREEVTVEVEDSRLLPQIFDREPWLFRRTLEGEVQILYAECRLMGKLVRVKLGPYERFRRYFELMDKEPPLILEEERKEEVAKVEKGMEEKAETVLETPKEEGGGKAPPIPKWRRKGKMQPGRGLKKLKKRVKPGLRGLGRKSKEPNPPPPATRRKCSSTRGKGTSSLLRR